MQKVFKLLNLLFISATFSSFLSCVDVLNIDLPKHLSSPVVNCFFTNDTILKLRLSKTKNLFDTSTTIINNAKIYLYEDDIIYSQLTYQDGFYYSANKLKLEKKYFITLKIPNFNDFDDVSAYDILPSLPNLQSSSFLDSVLIDQSGFPISQVIINIQDNSNKNQYYEVLIELKYKRSFTDSIYETKIADYCKENYDPVIANEGLVEFIPQTLIFSNENFINQTYPLKVNFQNLLYLEDSYPQYKELKVIVHLRKISEFYYQFKRKLIIHQFSIQNDFWSGSTEPSLMFTNINGGYGIFAAYTEVVDTLTKFYSF